MAEEDVVETTETAPSSNAMPKWLIRIGLLLLAFLIGFVPGILLQKDTEYDLRDARHALRRNQLTNRLSAATIYARRGEYETARQNTSTFYTDVRSEMDKGNDGILTEQERIGVGRVMAERDEIITLLSRNDPAAAERLSNAFIEYVGVVPNK